MAEFGEEQRIEDLTRKTAEDVSELAKRAGGLAGEELMDVGRRAFVPTVITAIGGVFTAAGIGAFLLAPGSDEPGRMRRLGFGYLLVGAAGSIVGFLTLTKEATTAMPRTRRAVSTAVDTVREHATT